MSLLTTLIEVSQAGTFCSAMPNQVYKRQDRKDYENDHHAASLPVSVFGYWLAHSARKACESVP